MNLRDAWIVVNCHFCHSPMHLTKFEQILWQGQERIKSTYRCRTCPYVTSTLTTREQAASILGGEGYLPFPLAQSA